MIVNFIDFYFAWGWLNTIVCLIGYYIVYIKHRDKSKPKFINIIWIIIFPYLLILLVLLSGQLLQFDARMAWAEAGYLKDNYTTLEKVIVQLTYIQPMFI